METDNNTQYNEDELHAPEWLNKEYIEKVLRQYNKCNSVQVEKYEISPGTGKTDHYASIMFRVKVHYIVNGSSGFTNKFIALIVKAEPETGSLKGELLKECSLFQTEILMYSEILPRMTQLLRAAGDETKLNAELVYYESTPRRCLIFEDLKEKGYTVVSKRSCTLEEVRVVIGILARIHAIGYKLYQENTDIPKPKSFFRKENLENFVFLTEGLILCKELLANDENLKKYIPKFENVENTLMDEVYTYFDENDNRKRGNIMVLNHGDFHTKNIMINYKDNILQHLILLDYQACYYGSPVLDLMHAFVMMYGPEIRFKHHEQVFSEYIETFQQTLKELQFKGNIPTKEDFKEEWNKYKRWELYLLINFLILTYTMLDGNVAVSDVIEKSEVRKKFWQNESFLNEMRKQIPRLVEGGYFD